MRNLKRMVASKLPRPIYEFLRDWRRHRRERRFFRQDLTGIRCGAYDLQIPSRHLLLQLQKAQPYRDLCIGVTAKFVAAKRPGATIVDVGANIGDTAALIATYAPNKLILVEAGDYYFEILAQNVKQLPNEVVLEKVMVASGRSVQGVLHHWGWDGEIQRRSGGNCARRDSPAW